MITGLMRVKNEVRWIERSITSIMPLCDEIIVFDDHSTDGTPELCSAMGVGVEHSSFEGCDEARDKNWLLDQSRHSDWIVMIDGDEELVPSGVELLRRQMKNSDTRSISMDVLYLWDRSDQVRIDGVYGDFCRQSCFRPGKARFEGGPPPAFHCGNVPSSIRFPYVRSSAQLLHYGYLDRADRIRKYQWYNEVDPNNYREDCYRHMVIGDLFLPDVKMVHGGPLSIAPLKDVIQRER